MIPLTKVKLKNNRVRDKLQISSEHCILTAKAVARDALLLLSLPDALL